LRIKTEIKALKQSTDFAGLLQYILILIIDMCYLPGASRLFMRTCLRILREPRCCANPLRSRREAQVIAIAIANPINTERGGFARNP